MSESKVNTYSLDEYQKIQRENAELKRAAKDDAQNILTLIKQLRYCVGIAERGRNETMPEDVTPEVYLLEYVKDLERIIAESKEHCQCPACKDGVLHDSDCDVHNMPAMPNGKCNCGAIQDGMVLVSEKLTESIRNTLMRLFDECSAGRSKLWVDVWTEIIEASKEKI